MNRQQRNFAYLLKNLSRLYTRAFEQASGALNLTISQCRVLTQLEHHEGVTQVRLAELTETDPMTLMRLLDRMEQDQWLTRRQDPQDRRTKRLYLEPAAKPVLEQIYRFSDRVRSRAMAGIPATQRKQLIQMLEHVQINLATLTADDDDTGKDDEPPTAAGKPA